jgi:hypothetical protein
MVKLTHLLISQGLDFPTTSAILLSSTPFGSGEMRHPVWVLDTSVAVLEM